MEVLCGGFGIEIYVGLVLYLMFRERSESQTVRNGSVKVRLLFTLSARKEIGMVGVKYLEQKSFQSQPSSKLCPRQSSK